ncbi:hypothetical protein [Myxacorys almedinensis]|uniref:hypothetical protein n=1 Tax=Myxacorys almedinensis TaxID=2651157 RepID=UPI001EE40EE8|nr:hypothetical protein [Myxacorys almedinensis]
MIAILCGEQTEPNCGKESAVAIARQPSDPFGEAAGLGSLGNVYRLQNQAIARQKMSLFNRQLIWHMLREPDSRYDFPTFGYAIR